MNEEHPVRSRLTIDQYPFDTCGLTCPVSASPRSLVSVYLRYLRTCYTHYGPTEYGRLSRVMCEILGSKCK